MIYCLKIEGKYLEVEVFVNEYRLYHQSKEFHGDSMLLTPWLSAGENLLRVKIHRPFVEKQSSGKADFNSLLTVSISEIDDVEKQVASYVWPDPRAISTEGHSSGASSSFPVDTIDLMESHDDLVFNVPIDYVLPPAPWKEATLLVPSLEPAYELFDRIYGAIASGDLAQIVELSKHKIDYSAQLADVDNDSFHKECVEDYKDFIDSGLSLKEYHFPRDELMFHMFKDQVVFRVLDLNGAMPLRTVADSHGIQTGYDLIFAVKGSELVWIM